jgi:proteasome lid subunit RPN8/RPN11
MATKAPQEELEFGTWRAEAAAYSVEYSLQVMEELRTLAEAGYRKIPHGGIECGALLLGSLDGDVVRIREWRPIECEHALGPGFVLSENDLTGLAALLERVGLDPVLDGLVPVGWFHTHTRSSLFLSEQDIAVHRRFFHEPWQVALVMALAKDQPVRAGFFLRQPDGALYGAASAQVFTVAPNPAMLSRPSRRTGASTKPVALPVVETPPPKRTTPSRARPLGFSATAPAVPTPAVLEQPAAATPKQPAELPPPPSFLQQQPERPGFAWKLLAVVAGVLVLGGVAVVGWSIWTALPADAIALRLEEKRDQLIVRWDHNAAPVRRAQRAVLQIADGAGRTQLDLNAEEARLGSVTYARGGEDVEVRLTLYEDGRQSAQESARFLGPPVAPSTPAEPAPIPTVAELREERDRLRRALRDEQARGERLRQTMRQLENQVRQ